MRIVVIYDNRRPEKYTLIEQEMKRQGITKYQIVGAALLNTVVESISESFKSIIRKAKENKEKEVLIFEDDIYFPSENGFKYFIKNKPKEYDVYIGGTYLIDNRIEYTEPLVRVNEWIGNHAIMIHERYYDRWLDTDQTKHCDTVHAGNGEFYVCFPFAALQRIGWSANNHAVCDYNSILPKEYIFE